MPGFNKISFAKTGADINYEEFLINALILCNSNVDWTRYEKTETKYIVEFRLPSHEDSEENMFEGIEL